MSQDAGGPSRPTLPRRALLAGLGGFPLGGPPDPPSEPYQMVEITAPTAQRPRPALVLVPRDEAPAGGWPLLVLLHGLGETRSPRAGVRAWLEPYGLGKAWRELSRPLSARPFAGMVIVCPFLPNPYASGRASSALDEYADWTEKSLLPSVRARVPSATTSAQSTAIAGVSLGGYAALEVFLRRPAPFSSVGTVQGAFGRELAARYARELASFPAAQRPSVYVATSTDDPYRDANLSLGKALLQEKLRTRVTVRPGPHSQGWLRSVGSRELLLFFDRALRGHAETGGSGL